MSVIVVKKLLDFVNQIQSGQQRPQLHPDHKDISMVVTLVPFLYLSLLQPRGPRLTQDHPLTRSLRRKAPPLNPGLYRSNGVKCLHWIHECHGARYPSPSAPSQPHPQPRLQTPPRLPTTALEPARPRRPGDARPSAPPPGSPAAAWDSGHVCTNKEAQASAGAPAMVRQWLDVHRGKFKPVPPSLLKWLHQAVQKLSYMLKDLFAHTLRWVH